MFSALELSKKRTDSLLKFPDILRTNGGRLAALGKLLKGIVNV